MDDVRLSLEIGRKELSVDEAVTSHHTRRSPLCENVQKSGLSSTRLAHERSKLPRRIIPRNVIQQPPGPTAHRYRVLQMMPREYILHRRRFRQHLLIVHHRAFPRSSTSTLFIVVLLFIAASLIFGGFDDGSVGSTFEECDGGGGGRRGVHLSEEEVGAHEADAEGAQDTEVLRSKHKTTSKWKRKNELTLHK